MFQSDRLNALFTVVSQADKLKKPYAVLCDMAAEHHGTREYKIISGVIAYALDALEDDTPLDVVSLESLIEDTVQGVIDDHSKLGFEARMARIYLKDKEHEFTTMMGNTQPDQTLNFSKCEQHLEEMVKHRLQPNALETMEEIVVSNRVLKVLGEEIRVRADQLLACSDWRDSEQYGEFISAYAAARKSVVMNTRKASKMERFGL